MSNRRLSAAGGIRLAAFLWVTTVVSGAFAQANQPESMAFSTTRTGKERLSDKTSDEQRVDDCKVSPARRTKVRPTNCPWDAGS